MNNFLDRYNAAWGGIIALCTAIFGPHWYLFAAYLFFQMADYITGVVKARRLHTESSRVGLWGIVKKLLYWLLVISAFLSARVLTTLVRDFAGVDTNLFAMLGWFTLGMLLINEVRSILENLVECGVEVPSFLVKGLAVADKLLAAKVAAEDTDNTGSTDQ